MSCLSKSHKACTTDAIVKDDGSDTITCANCGEKGHVYRYCYKPVISYGIICFRYNSRGPEYLIVQRKDTFAFVEFIRGKYELGNLDYVTDLFLTMAPFERSIIRDNDFDFCWKFLWKTSGKGRRVLEFDDSKSKFNALKSLTFSNDDGSEELEMDRVMRKCESVKYEPEWGFPKGRRNINESDMKTAFREFSEETGIHTESLMLLSHTPFEETFRGSNGVKYKHVYYLARVDDSCKISLCPTELRDFAWQDKENLRSKFAGFPERIRMLDRVHDFTVRRGCNFGLISPV